MIASNLPQSLKRLLLESLALYLRHTKIETGRFRLLTLGRPLAREIGFRLGKRIIVTRLGFQMEVDLADWIPQDIYLTGDFEPVATELAKRLLARGDTAIDVGANIGYFSLLFGHCVGEEGAVFSFEPVPGLADQLRRNVQLNRLRCIKIREIALSDSPSRGQLNVGPDRNTGLSSLRGLPQSSGSIEVQLASLDSLHEAWGRVTLVKIDVEGAELKVLRGMKNLLQERRPHLLVEVTERFLRSFGDSTQSLLDYLRNFGYYCYSIDDVGVTLQGNSISTLPEQWNAIFCQTKLFGSYARLV